MGAGGRRTGSREQEAVARQEDREKEAGEIGRMRGSSRQEEKEQEAGGGGKGTGGS